MITDALLATIFAIFKFIFGLFPPVPALPQPVIDGAYYFFDKVNEVNGVMIYLISEPLYIAGISIILFVMLYHLMVKVIILMVFKFLLKKVIG